MEIKNVKSKKTKKKKKNGIKTAAVVVLVLLIIAATLFVLSQTVLFKIKNIEVKGSQIYSPEEILNTCKISSGDLLYSLNNQSKCNSITTALPYIKSVKLSQKLPETLIITVTDNTAQYQFESGGVYYLADSDYKVLEIAQEQNENLINITASGIINPKAGYKAEFVDKSKLDVITKISQKCDQYDNITLTSIDLSDDIYINFTVNKTVDVKLGSEVDIDYKFSHLSGMLKELPTDVRGEINLESYSQKDPKGYFKGY